MGDSQYQSDVPQAHYHHHQPLLSRSRQSPEPGNDHPDSANPNGDPIVHSVPGRGNILASASGQDGISPNSERADFGAEGKSIFDGSCGGASATEHGGYEKDVDSVDQMCALCGGTPCLWSEIGDEIVAKVEDDLMNEDCSDDNNLVKRKQAYKLYTYERYGFLGMGNRKKIPRCAMEGIRAEWPDPRGSYMGYRSE